MADTRICGADPGMTGGLVMVRNGAAPQCLPMPRTADKEIDLPAIREWLVEADPTHVFLEKVSAMVRPGTAIGGGWGSVQNHRIGRCVGQIEGLVVGMCIPLTLVAPQRWQAMMHKDKNGEKYPEQKAKERSARAVRELFPNMTFSVGRSRKEHDGLVDACLVALYGWHVMHDGA